MRQWNVPPSVMCRRHFLGEHAEQHMFWGSMAKGIDLTGYVRDGLLDGPSLLARHAELVEDFPRRGYFHASPPPGNAEDLAAAWPGTVDSKANLVELARRCPECKALIEASIESLGIDGTGRF